MIFIFSLIYFGNAFMLNVAVTPDVSSNIADLRCLIAFLPYNASDPTSDPAPYNILLTDKTMARNTECANLCGTGDVMTQANAGMAGGPPEDTYFCAKDVSGGCARAYFVGTFATKAKSCDFSMVNGKPNLNIEFDSYNMTEAFFPVSLRRSNNAQYKCANAMKDSCMLVKSCGTSHIVANKRAATSECDSNCDASPSACGQYVCAKTGADCFVYDRLASLPGEYDATCDFRAPTDCAKAFLTADPFTYVPTPKSNAVAPKFCCSTGSTVSTGSTMSSVTGGVTTTTTTTMAGANGNTTTGATSATTAGATSLVAASTIAIIVAMAALI